MTGRKKSMVLAYVLLLLGGGLGLHRFYLGRPGSGFTLAAIALGAVFTIPLVVPALALLVIFIAWIVVDLFLIPGMVGKANQGGSIVYNSPTAPTGSDAPPYGPTSYADTAKDASEEWEWAREEEEQQRQLTSPLTTPTDDRTPHNKLAAVKELIALPPREALDEAESFLTRLG